MNMFSREDAEIERNAPLSEIAERVDKAIAELEKHFESVEDENVVRAWEFVKSFAIYA